MYTSPNQMTNFEMYAGILRRGAFVDPRGAGLFLSNVGI